MSITNSSIAANPREQHGVALATNRKIGKTERGWVVPSQRGDGRYTVALDLRRCTCPDHELRKAKCKHIFAVETTFAMIKGKFGSHLRSKGDTAQINEALCKIPCHNICVLIHSMHEFGIDPALGR